MCHDLLLASHHTTPSAPCSCSVRDSSMLVLGLLFLFVGFLLFHRILGANPNRAVFLLHNWRDLVKSLQGLLHALLDKKGQNAREVRKAMERLCLSMAAFIDPTDNSSARAVEEGEQRGAGVEEKQKDVGLLNSMKRLQYA